MQANINRHSDVRVLYVHNIHIAFERRVAKAPEERSFTIYLLYIKI